MFDNSSRGRFSPNVNAFVVREWFKFSDFFVQIVWIIPGCICNDVRVWFRLRTIICNLLNRIVLQAEQTCGFCVCFARQFMQNAEANCARLLNTIWWCGRCRQIQRGTADADNKHDCVRRTDYLCGELAYVVWRRAGSATRRINAWSRECLIIRCGGTFPFVSVWILRILWRIDRISGARRYRSGFYKYARGM